MAAIIGILIGGKMSVGVLNAAMVPNIRIRIASTIKVSGRRSATRTTAFMPKRVRYRAPNPALTLAVAVLGCHRSPDACPRRRPGSTSRRRGWIEAWRQGLPGLRAVSQEADRIGPGGFTDGSLYGATRGCRHDGAPARLSPTNAR